MLHDVFLALSGLFVGITVGLTGMGGGALLTPLLVFVFGVPPLQAVSTDLLTALVMKPVGVVAHARHGSVRWTIVRYLCIGSIPGALIGTLIAHHLGSTPALSRWFNITIGVVLSTSVVAMGIKALLQHRRHESGLLAADVPLEYRATSTIVIGLIGGTAVGMTSVGAGSLMLILLLFTYPTLSASKLVGTDLAQAVPLVATATAAHMLFGDVSFSMAGWLLVGALPGVYLGARITSIAPDAIVRQALAIVLSASALKLFGVPTPMVGLLLLCTLVVWALVATVRRIIGGTRTPGSTIG